MTAVARRETTFSAIRQDNAPRKMSINPSEERLTTLLAANSIIEGNLCFTEGVKVDGRIKGDLTFGTEDGLCIVSHGAVIEGNLRGPKALILGEVQGNIEVDFTLVLAPSAVVVGSVRCGRFVVYDGASVTGSIETIRHANDSAVQTLEVSTAVPAVPAAPDAAVPLKRRLWGGGR